MFRSTAAVFAVTALVAAPAALAQPSDQDGVQPLAPVAHPTAVQLRAIDGHQPRESRPGPVAAAVPAAPRASQPDDVPTISWVVGVLAVFGLGTAGLARATASARHRHQPSA